MKLSYWGYFTPFSGYGIANLNWVKHLRRAGHDVVVDAKFTPRPGTNEWEVLNEEERQMFEAPFEVRDIGIVETTPEYFHLNKSKIKVANTMGETDKLGEGWVKACNRMDHIIVPNDFYYRVFSGSGVTKPVVTIPHGVDTKRFSYVNRSKSAKDPFTFGCIGYLNKRKGVFELIQAFHSEFDLDENVRLRLHTTDPELNFYKNLADPRIEITNQLWDFDEVVDFYHSLDAFVFPSKAEGIGYPPREAMSTGLPTILMDYSGLEDIADWGFAIKPDGFTHDNPMKEQIGRWAKIDIQELMGAMRYVYENQDLAKKVGRAAAVKMKKNYSWESCVTKLVEFLNGLS